MDQTTIQKYLNVEYPKALEFYDARSKKAKLTYRILSIYLIVISALLTTLVAFAPDEVGWKILSSLLSATIVISTSLLAHLKCHENWLSYRSSWDSLERERRSYETRVGVYRDTEDPESVFVERIEALLAKEGADFYSRHATKDSQRESGSESEGSRRK